MHVGAWFSVCGRVWVRVYIGEYLIYDPEEKVGMGILYILCIRLGSFEEAYLKCFLMIESDNFQTNDF